MTESLALALAYLLDLIIGDPKQLPHPVRLIGRAIEKTEHYLRGLFTVFEGDDKPVVNENSASGEETGDMELDDAVHERIDISLFVPSFLKKGEELSVKAQERLAGSVLTAVIAGATYLVFFILQAVLLSFQDVAVASYVSFAVLVYLIATTVATRDLLRSGQAVIDEIKKGNLENSRAKLSMIVGRDTGSLKEAGVLKATIETLAENASDGIVAPLFYFVIGGLPLAMTYKAVNTLDSMVGYKNLKYIHFGWMSARLDDAANYIPARITALLIIAGVYILNALRYIASWSAEKHNTARNRAGRYITALPARLARYMERPDFEIGHRAFVIMKRDGKKHTSPNSGFPEAAMAGALGVRLGGPSTYEGQRVLKPYIGEEKESTLPFYIKACEQALLLTKITSLSGLLCALVFV